MIKKTEFRHFSFLPIYILILTLLAGLIRARINFSSEMIPGINGGYYPLLVRNLLEYGSVRYPDAPLVYWVQSLISMVIRVFSAMPIDQSVLLSSRIFDSFFPPLTCIPVYLMAREHLKDQPQTSISVPAISSFSVLYLSFLFIMTSEMQKNAAGLVWLACYLFSLSRMNGDKNYKKLLISLLFLILTSITHIGCFAVAFMFTVIYGLIRLIRSPRRIRTKTIVIVLSGVTGLILISLAILLKDPDRMHRVISFYLNPLRIFESPYLLILLAGKQVYFGFLFHNFLLINTLAIALFITLLINRKNLSSNDFCYALGLSLLSLFLSSPLIGIEWALRYYLMAFLPISFLFVYIYKSLPRNYLKTSLSVLLVIISLFSAMAAIAGKRSPAISDEAFADLKSLKSEISINPDDLIVARHGLEWWTGWVMRCRTGKEYCLRPGDWEKYPNIYLLRQKSGNNFPGQRGTGQFAEFPFPVTAGKMASNISFDLYKLEKPDESQFFPGVMPLLQGEVKAIDSDRVTVRSDGYPQKVIITESTRFIECRPGDIKPGMRADIWGERVPFSLKIKARQIRVYAIDKK